MRLCLCLLTLALVTALPVQSQDSQETGLPATPEATSDPSDVDKTKTVAKAYFSFERGSFLIGEPVKLTLNFEIPVEGTRLIGWPELPADWPSTMITEVGERVDTEDGVTRKYQQEFTVILWEPGDHRTPDVFIDFQLDSGEVYHIPVEPAFISIPSVLDGVDFDLRPFKPPIALPYISPWLVLGGGGGLAFAFRRWRQSRARPFPQESEGPTPLQLALEELQQISKEESSPAAVYARVADCLRAYAQRRFGVPALDMTTDELISSLECLGHFPERLRKELRHLLSQADLVKFARVQPTEHTANRLLAVARGWLQRVDASQALLKEAIPSEAETV